MLYVCCMYVVFTERNVFPVIKTNFGHSILTSFKTCFKIDFQCLCELGTDLEVKQHLRERVKCYLKGVKSYKYSQLTTVLLLRHLRERVKCYLKGVKSYRYS